MANTGLFLRELEDDVYQFIIGYKVDHDGNSPTLAEINEEMGITTKSHTHFVLDSLERKGVIKREQYKSRSITVIGGQYLPPDGRG